jgi:lysozyme
MKKVNKAGIDIIKSFEGLHLKPYLCPANIPTIGYGSIKYPNGKKVSLKDPSITEQQALEFLQHEIDVKSKGVENLVKVDINENEFSALVSFAFNVGLGALGSSTLLRLLNSNANRVAVADQLLRWNKAGGKELRGLTRRREAERSLFLQPVKEESQSLGDTPSEEEINKKLEKLEKDILNK